MQNTQGDRSEPPAFLYSDVLNEPPALKDEHGNHGKNQEDDEDQAIHQQDQEAFMMIKDHTTAYSPKDNEEQPRRHDEHQAQQHEEYGSGEGSRLNKQSLPDSI